MCECVMTVYSNPKSPYEIRICDWISYLCAADLVGEPCGPPHEQAGGVDLCLHVGEHEADRLVHDDRLAEGLALLGVLQRVLVGSPGDAHGHGGHGRAGSEERRVGKEWGSTCRSRGAPDPSKQTKHYNN